MLYVVCGNGSCFSLSAQEISSFPLINDHLPGGLRKYCICSLWTQVRPCRQVTVLHTRLCSLFHSDAYQYSCPAFSSGLIELDIATYACIGYSVKCIIHFSRICYYCLSISSKADMRFGVSDDLVVNEDRGCFSSQYFKQIISVFIFLRFKLCSLFAFLVLQ